MTTALKPVSSFEELKLGMKVKDLVMGIEGTIGCIIWRPNGWKQVSIQPMGDGKEIKDGADVDWQTVAIIDAIHMTGIVPELIPHTVQIGDQVEETNSGTKGKVTSLLTFLNGCNFVMFQPKADKDNKLPDKIHTLESNIRVIKKVPEEKKPAVEKPISGGPSQRSIRPD